MAVETNDLFSDGEWLAKARTAAGLEQDELAARIGKSRTTVSRWENNKGGPNVATLKKIIAVTGASWLWSVFGPDQGGNASAWMVTAAA